MARGRTTARRGGRLSAPASALAERLDELTRARTQANRDFFEAEAERIARCCHRMAERFARGGRLIAFGATPVARSDARHVAVEFVHPVIVGKRALPAIGLAAEGGELLPQARAVCEADDIAIAFGCEEGGPGATDARDALIHARDAGCLTIAFGGDTGAEWEFLLPVDLDAFVRQELIETLYHLLWELVHVFFDHRGLLEGREARQVHDPGASSFLYPFLSESQTDLEAVVADVRGSVLLKAEEVGALREQTLNDNRDELTAAAAALRTAFEAGGRLIAFGNGGSATDAMDVAADFRVPLPDGRGESRRALDLTEDTSIITAVANDVGVEAIFQRQVIAHGRAGDAALALSTSGNSLNIIDALAEARRRELVTIAMVGYDGGQVAQNSLADHVIVTRSQHIPRIQEAQASAYHALRELVELAVAGN
jgi:D-sedoheptulose 7-phosphate isomerase